MLNSKQMSNSEKDTYITAARQVIKALRDKKPSRDITMALRQMGMSNFARNNSSVHQLVLSSIQFPLVILLLLQCGIYMTTFSKKNRMGQNIVYISENVKQLFVAENLTKSDELYTEGTFVKNPHLSQEQFTNGIAAASKFVYNAFVKDWGKMSAEQVNQQLRIIQQVLVEVYEIAELGVRALESAENSAWTTSALQLVTYVGCNEGIFVHADQAAKCGAMQALYDNLLTRSLNPNL